MSDLFSLDGKHVLVTGGSSGLGRFFAVLLAARGAQVTVAARRAEALECRVVHVDHAFNEEFAPVLEVLKELGHVCLDLAVRRRPAVRARRIAITQTHRVETI